MSAIALPPLAAPRVSERLVSLAGFAALATLASLEYARLVAAPPTLRIVSVVAIATALGAASGAAFALRALGAIIAAAAAMIALGVPAQLLEPAHWSALVDDLSQGLGGLNGFEWPYAGDDQWIRIAILLAIPLLTLAAAVLAFWPARRGAAVRRACALALLLALYGVGSAERHTGAWAANGALLLALAAVWLWLPRLRFAELGRAALWLVAVGGIAVAVTLGVRRHDPLIDYQGWNLFSGAGGGTTFAWDQLYGPISWPRTGEELLDVSATGPHYWKTETLDRFDGVRWIRSDTPAGSVSRLDVPQQHRWMTQMSFTVRGLRSDLIVGAGTTLNVDSAKVTAAASDGTTRVEDAPLARGDSYTVDAYVPTPTPAEMAHAPARLPAALAPYTYFDLPRAAQSGLDPPDVSARARATHVTARTVSGTEAPQVRRRILASPYAQTYMLARSLGAGQPTAYDVVESVETYLQRGFTYSERPPRHRYPLAAFLFDDRAGYCQQFSGAMALMLRMDGIPARVAAGFAPGAYDSARRRYVVRDYDAHSWVEVYFSGIGWVAFDPTPAVAPAVGRSAAVGHTGDAPPVPADAGAAARRLNGSAHVARGRVRRAARSASGGFGLGLALAAAALVATAALVLRRRRLRTRPADVAVAELRGALERLGHSCPPRTTLAELERRLGAAVGPASARYVRRLRQQRFAAARDAAPGPRDRAALRRELAAGRGLPARVRAYAALPPIRLVPVNLTRIQLWSR